MLAATMTLTSVDLTAFAASADESLAGDVRVIDVQADAAAEQELKDKLESSADPEEHPGGVFGFYETLLNATEGDELTISVVRQGSTEKETSVVFKAVDVSTVYKKDYVLSVEGGLLGEKELPAAEGVRPLLEEYGEAATAEDQAAFMNTEAATAEDQAAFMNTEAATAGNPTAKASNSETITEDPTAEASNSETITEDPTAVASNMETITEDPTDDASNTEVATDTVAPDKANEKSADSNETGREDRTENDLSYLSSGSSLANMYAFQTGGEAPEYDWTEYAENEAPEETIEAMKSGWDETRENLQSLPGVTVRLDFAPGEYKKDIKVRVKDDDKSESDEVILFVLQEAEGAEIGDSYNGYLNISDNDSHEEITYSVKEKTLTVTPDQDTATVTVVRNSGIDQMDFVTVGTQADDAVADEDYVRTYKQLFFAAGITEVTVDVPIMGLRENETHFWVGIRSTNGTVLEDNACYVTIAADTDRPAEYVRTVASADDVMSDYASSDAITEDHTSSGDVPDPNTSIAVGTLSTVSDSVEAVYDESEESASSSIIPDNVIWETYAIGPPADPENPGDVDAGDIDNLRDIDADNTGKTGDVDADEIDNLGAIDPYEKQVYMYGNDPANTGYMDGNAGWKKVLGSIDLRTVDYVKVNYEISGFERNYFLGMQIGTDRKKSSTIELWDPRTRKAIKPDINHTHEASSDHPNETAYYVDAWKRDASETWNYDSAEVWAKVKGEDISDGNAHLTVKEIRLGYNVYNFVIRDTYNNMNEYVEKKISGIQNGKPIYATGNIVRYPEVYFLNGIGDHVSSKQVMSGDDVVSYRATEGQTANTQGVYATDDTVDFKGFKLVKPGERGVLSDIVPASFKVDNAFKVKYKDYIYPDGTIELVPIYEPKTLSVSFNNDYAKVDGKADVRGVYAGFATDSSISCTTLDTLDVTVKANAGNAATYMALQRPISFKNSSDIRWNGWREVANNRGQAKSYELISRLDYSPGWKWNDDYTKSYYTREMRVVTYYDDASITVAPNPQSTNGAVHGSIMYVDGVIKGDDPDLGEVKKGGETLKLDKTSINRVYTFGSIPETDYHTYWKDGTLDIGNDGQSEGSIPGYSSFLPSFGEALRYVTVLPVSRIYYNFVKDVTTKEVDPQPLRGYLQIRDKLLVSGDVTDPVGLNGITVYSDQEDTITGKGSYAGKKYDGYYELKDGNYYDIYTYAVTFSGPSVAGTIAAMITQNPSRRETTCIDTWNDVNISDVKLFIEQDKKDKSGKEYVVIDTSGVKKGYYTGLTDGDYNYRIQMKASRAGVNLSKAVMTFYYPGGSGIEVIGSEDGNHSGIFTFDFNPNKLQIKAGATARVAFSTDDTTFLSRDVGIKIRASLGALNVTNFLFGGNGDARVDIIGAVNTAMDMGWKGNFDLADVSSDVYQDDEGNQVIKVGISKKFSKASKDEMLKAAEEAADQAKKAGKANSAVAKLENKLSNASEAEKKELEKQLSEAKDELAVERGLAKRKQNEFNDKLEDAKKPQKNKPKFGNSFSMDLGFSFLMTFGYDEDVNSWYFKNMMLTASLGASYTVTMNYATPIGVTIGIGLTLKVDGSATFVVEERSGFENDKNYRYYVNESNKNDFNILDSDGDDPNRKLDNEGLFSVNPSIELSLSAGVAGDLIKVTVSGNATFNMVFGTKSDSAGSCNLSASISIHAIVFTFSKELANKTFPLWGDQDVIKTGDVGALYSNTVMHALGEGVDSYLFDSIDEFEPENVSYMSEGTVWYGGQGMFDKNASEPAVESDGQPVEQLGAIDEGGENAYRESPLASRISSDADFNMVSLGDGRFAAVFLNVPADRASDGLNSRAAYYTYYDGNSWTLPELLEDDGTLDFYPHIYSLGDKGAFIVWSSVNEKYKDSEDKLNRQNALDLHGRFVASDGSLSAGMEEITRTTEDAAGAALGLDFSDFAADRAFGVFTDGNKMIVGYEKRQYGRSSSNPADEADGADATVGDMIYPVSSLIAARSYDFTEGKWAEGKETLTSMPGLAALGAIAEERLEAYNESVYGQKFSNYLPGVMLHEDIEEPGGYYREGGSRTTAVKLANANNGMLLETDAAEFVRDGKTYGIFAYTVDADGNLHSLEDQQLYLVTYDVAEDKFSDPIILTGQEINSDTNYSYTPVNSNPRFINTDGGLYLTWLRGADIVACDISSLMHNESELVLEGELDGISYRYVDKSDTTEDTAPSYIPPKQLVTGRIGEEVEGADDGLTGDIHSFDVSSDGRYIYIIWPECMEHDEADPVDFDSLSDTQMWCVRTEVSGEDGHYKLLNPTKPVQITSHPGNHYDDVAFGVTDGKLIGLARKVPSRLITSDEARKIHPETYDEASFVPYAVRDDEEAYPVSFWVDPASVARIKNVGFLELNAGEDAAFSFEVLNDGFDTMTGATVTARDADGNILLYEYVTDEDEEGSIEKQSEIKIDNLIGGDRASYNGLLPLDENAGEATVFITVTTADHTSVSTTIHADLSPDVEIYDLEVEPTGTRNRYHVTGTVENVGTAKSDAGSITLVSRKDDKDRRLERVQYPELKPGEKADIGATITVTDEDFIVSMTDVCLSTGEIIPDDGDSSISADDTGTMITEELQLYAKYSRGTDTVSVPVYDILYSADDDPEYEFISRVAYPEETKQMEYVTGVSVGAIRAVTDDKGAVTGGEVVSSGTGLITLEAGERVEIRADILNNSPRKGGQIAVDGDDNIVDTNTGSEGLTYRYEFIGDSAEFDESGMLNALTPGTGRLRVYVYPADRMYSAANGNLPENTGEGDGISVLSMSDGEYEDTFYDYPAGVIKTYLLDVEIVGAGERPDAGNATFTDANGIIYRISGKSEAAVCGLDSDKKITKITIPATVKNDGQTYTVTGIDAGAFRGNNTLQTVTVGKNVTTIRSEAFADCTALTKVTFGASVTTIGERAFAGCIALKGITLPSKLVTLEKEAFAGCESITSVTLPATLEALGEKAFCGCGSLKSINVKSEKLETAATGRDAFEGISENAEFKLSMKDAAIKDAFSRTLTEETETFSDKKGIIYSVESVADRKLTVIGLTEAARLKLKSVSIPATVNYKGYKYSVTGIADGAFEGNERLTKVTLPKTVTRIGSRAFADMSALKSAVIPASVTTIGSEAFEGCTKLVKVTISSDKLSIGTDAFAGVPDTAKFKITSKSGREGIITQIIGDTDHFLDKKGLKYEIFSLENEEVTLTGTDNRGITSLSVPAAVEFRSVKFSVTGIGEEAFKGNIYLKSVTLGKNTGGIGEEAFRGCTSLTKVTMKNVVNIDAKAFMGCTSLKSLTLSKTLSRIGLGAFDGCTALKAVKLPVELGDIEADAFDGCLNLAAVTVQSGDLMHVDAGAFEGISSSAVFKITVKAAKERITKLLTEAGVDPSSIK